MLKTFRAVDEAFPGSKWLEHYRAALPSYRRWFARQGDGPRPALRECVDALERHMPELLPLWKHLVEISGADDDDARMLTFYCPAPNLAGCSQAVWTRYSPILVRNYDYAPQFCEGRIARTHWHHQDVIATTDCLWGVLDGMNEHGLAASLAFGGKTAVAEGFGIALILRYVLEFCTDVDEAVRVLCRVPSHMAYNITLLDAHGQVRTVELSPFSTPQVRFRGLAVNHQGEFEFSQYAMFSHSFERQQFLIGRLTDPLVNIGSFVDAFEFRPLFASNYAQGFGTLYTVVYNPQLRAMEYRWPHRTRMYQSFAMFEECEIVADLR